MKERSFAAPVVALLLTLTILAFYIVSYLLLVNPPGKPGLLGPYGYYRAGEPVTWLVFYPLNQIDRAVRPKAWITPRKE